MALLALITQTPKVTLTYFQEHFIIRDGINNESAPLKLAPESPKLSTVFRRNSTFVVWDERGLTVRVGQKVKSTKLPDVVTSPRAFSRGEILATRDAIRQCKRSRDVAGLSGASRVGNHVYFLARWEDRDGKPWTEALVQIDLTEKFPEPKLVGRVRAQSIANKAIDDQLFILDGQITYIARTDNQWGLEQLDPRNNRFAFDPLGDKLESFVFAGKPSGQIGPRTGLFIEKAAYGTTVAGRIDLRSRTRKVLAESRSKMRFLDDSYPECLIVASGKSVEMLNAATGAQMDLPAPCSARRTSRGIVVWTPIADPKRAWLYDPVRWQGRAWWNANLNSPEGG